MKSKKSIGRFRCKRNIYSIFVIICALGHSAHRKCIERYVRSVGPNPKYFCPVRCADASYL